MNTKNLLDLILDVTIRDVTPDDLGFVVESWSRTMSPCYPESRLTVFRSQLKAYINTILTANELILVACAAFEPKIIYGFLAYNPNGIIRFAYIKPQHRQGGIMLKLLKQGGLRPPYKTSSRMTPIAQTIKDRHPDQIICVPYSE